MHLRVSSKLKLRFVHLKYVSFKDSQGAFNAATIINAGKGKEGENKKIRNTKKEHNLINSISKDNNKETEQRAQNTG